MATEFLSVLSRCEVGVSTNLIKAITTRFTRGSDGHINYSAFLTRYAHDPRTARERRSLKALLVHWLMEGLTEVTPSEALNFMRDRFSRYDVRLHRQRTGCLPREAMIRLLCRASNPVKATPELAKSLVENLERMTQSDGQPAQALDYTVLLRVAEEAMRQTMGTLCQDASPSEVSAPARLAPADSSTTMNVADYLLSNATDSERAHFEQLMELLGSFHTSHLTAFGAIAPIERGVEVALGPRLRFQLQFRVV